MIQCYNRSPYIGVHLRRWSMRMGPIAIHLYCGSTSKPPGTCSSLYENNIRTSSCVIFYDAILHTNPKRLERCPWKPFYITHTPL